MYEKRIAGMLENRLVEVSDGVIHNTAKGTKAARLFGWLRRFLSLDARPTQENPPPTVANVRAARRRSRGRARKSASTPQAETR
jgi:hypothetical protein